MRAASRFLRSSVLPGDTGTACVLDPTKLQPGDVVVTRGRSLVSLGIRAFTLSSASHAAIHVGGGFIVEAVDQGVRRLHVRSFVYAADSAVEVRRPIAAAHDQLLHASKVARSLVYRPYSVRGALGAVAPFCRASDDPGRFCSQLVAEALGAAGLMSRARPAQAITPGDLLKSRALEPVPEAKRLAAKRAIHHALAEMQPAWSIPSAPAGGLPQVSAETFEREALALAEAAMEQHACFRPPYHYFDAVRQMTSVFHSDRQAARSVDEALMAALQKFRVPLGLGVEPRSTIPGIVFSTPDPHLPRIFQAATEDEAEEIRRLHAELLAGRSWDEAEWQDTIDELDQQRSETALDSLTGTLLWLLGDQGRVLQTYRWLAGE
ncbi:hypothetical protein H8N03_10145 [Ramlibacter sp. USB13]|uniref:Permuted papain-like amidase enzyme, YaeF/YiiX, C92 family n=1 Tax=Ramlibacter cellulosilyticus TaxID=2764187 RepID=A0A923MPW9_9BURK|nr:hypothetical protein [Ramlibacter cellulosilyticus]MBC5783305.1 hypothetical protein [Ramlibacter cellulosilyticus]